MEEKDLLVSDSIAKLLSEGQVYKLEKFIGFVEEGHFFIGSEGKDNCSFAGDYNAFVRYVLNLACVYFRNDPQMPFGLLYRALCDYAHRWFCYLNTTSEQMREMLDDDEINK
ncbi:MAG: hypothetical protein K2N22_05290 [Clostridia bacterium]|nr:hypothetical protein [Clostridia bacterium]